MKKFKNLLIAVVCIAMISGCTPGKDDETAVSDGAKSEYAVSDKTVELTLYMVRTDSKLQEETEVWKKLASLANVKLKTINSRNVSDLEQSFKTMMASGDLPDLSVHRNKDDLLKFGMEGAFAPLNDLIDECAPNLKREYAKQSVKNHVTAPDGKIYCVTSIGEPTVSAGWFIRQDWLDKLGLDMPETVDEYHDVLVAFRDKDPNGNGKKDEIPYFSRFGVVTDLLGLWDCVDGWSEKDGKVFYSPASENYKIAYSNIAKWYAEDLIDKEIYTRGWKSRDKLLGDNVGGSTHDWFGSTAQFNEILKDTVPGLNMVAFAPPNGKEYYSRDESGNTGVAISNKSDKKTEALKFIDLMFSDIGSRYNNFGLEGKHYDMVDGLPIFQDWVINGDKTAINILEESGACSEFPYKNDFWYEEQWLTPTAREGSRMYLDNNYIVPKFPNLNYTVEENERLREIMLSVETLVQETSQKWVFGNEDVEKGFDKFVSNMYSMGLKEAEEIQQKAYDRYKAAMQ